MEFFIRPNNAEEGYPRKQQRYMEFLQQFERKNHPDLFAYFGADFFHDGEITAMGFQNAMQALFMRISCPNIKRYDSERTSKYIEPVWFTCFFYGVAALNMETRRLDPANNPLAGDDESVIFLESEINSLNADLSHYSSLYNEEFCSLLVKTLPVQRNFSIIFTNVIVEPEEPAAFELLRHHNDYHVPLFS